VTPVLIFLSHAPRSRHFPHAPHHELASPVRGASLFDSPEARRQHHHR
jgi:hypothetical protein